MVCESLFEDKCLIIFDTSWVAYASCLAKCYSWMSYDNKFTGHIVGTLTKILSSLRYFGKNSLDYTDLIFVFDRYPRKTYEIFPEYKANRVKEFDPVVDITKLVSKFTNKQAYADETEADHVIASIVAKYYKKYKNYKIYIISADKDLWQLLEYPNVYISPRIKEISSIEEFHKKFGLNNIKGIALHKAIFGDSSDNIPKLKGRLQHKPIKKYIDLSDGTPDSFYHILRNDYENDMRDKVYEVLISNEDLVRKMYGITKLDTEVNYTIKDNEVDIKYLDSLRSFLCEFGIFKFDNDIIKLFRNNYNVKPKLKYW